MEAGAKLKCLSRCSAFKIVVKPAGTQTIIDNMKVPQQMIYDAIIGRLLF
jgi:hypothetical protein